MSKRFEELLLRTETEALSRQLLVETPSYPRDDVRIAQLEIAFVEQALDTTRRRRAKTPKPAPVSSSRRVVDLLVNRLVHR